MLNKTVIKIKSDLYLKHASIFSNPSQTAKAVILYFHGGGLIFGQRDDLPDFHLQELCNAGYMIVTFDYPLAPTSKIAQIIDDVKDSIQLYAEQPLIFSHAVLPYFLWGRSAGAYLCLLAASHSYAKPPLGVISYYGYGFLADHWFNQPSPFYCRLPRISEECIISKSEKATPIGLLETCYSLYICARQQGKWIDQLFNEREKYFYRDFSLRFAQDFSLTQPIFLAHSINDPDVPYQEFLALSTLLKNSERYIVSDETHDFDRFTDTVSTKELLSRTIEFLNRSL